MGTAVEPEAWLQSLRKEYRKKARFRKPTRIFISRETYGLLWQQCLSRLTDADILHAPIEDIQMYTLTVCFTNDYQLGEFEITY